MVLCLFSCSKKTAQSTYYDTAFSNIGLNELVLKYSNGNTKERIPRWKNDTFFHGYWKSYDINGKLLKIIEYNHGKQVGLEMEFYPNGNLKYKTINKTGDSFTFPEIYYETGEIKGCASFFNGQPWGNQFGYFEDGSPKTYKFLNNVMRAYLT